MALISSDEHSAPRLPFIFPAKQTAATQPSLVFTEVRVGGMLLDTSAVLLRLRR